MRAVVLEQDEYTSVLLSYQNFGYEIMVSGKIWKEI